MVERATLNLQTFADGRSPPDLMLPGMQSPTGAHAVASRSVTMTSKLTSPRNLLKSRDRPYWRAIVEGCIEMAKR